MQKAKQFTINQYRLLQKWSLPQSKPLIFLGKTEKYKNRSRFIKAWINQPDSHALGILQNGKLAGYGVIRPCRAGYKIGPLFADSPELAESLFMALKSKVKMSEPVYLDTPEVNPAATALAERYNMKVSFETSRMYTGKQPDIPLNRLFGVTSFEIG